VDRGESKQDRSIFLTSMTTKVFITGGSGLLALNWALAIRESHAVTLCLHERMISLAGVQTQKMELEPVEDLVRTFDDARISMVVHAAGFTNVEKCEAKPDLARHTNVELAGNVAKACAKLGLPLIHISTDHLFSGEIPMLAESSPVTPVNVYGRTKAEAELHVLEAHPLALLIRTNFYGWGTSYRRSFSDVIIEALRSGKDLNLFTDVFYTPILVDTVAIAAHDLIDTKVTGIVNIVGDERISKYEFGIRIAEEFGLDAGLIKPGLLADQVALVQRPYDMSLSNQKISKLLGRKLGGVSEHLSGLHKQEKNGFSQEMRSL
jgi:dTDP-4-dehydrorhamnose reductase